MPALFQAFRHGSLPSCGRITGVGREVMTHEQYRAKIRERFGHVELNKHPSVQEFDRFAALLHCQYIDQSKPETYAQLAEHLASYAAQTVVMYLAVAPALFPVICEHIGAKLIGATFWQCLV